MMMTGSGIKRSRRNSSKPMQNSGRVTGSQTTPWHALALQSLPLAGGTAPGCHQEPLTHGKDRQRIR